MLRSAKNRMLAHIFDADGVIFDSESAHAASYREYLALFDIELSEDAFMERFHGQSGRDIMRALFPNATNVEIEQHLDDQNRLFRSEFVAQVQLIAGIEAFLERIHSAGMRSIIVTNGIRENVEAMLQAHRIHMRALSIEDFKLSKPDPAGYLKALETLEVDASDAVVYEDTPIGVRAAKKAGVRVVGIASYHDTRTLIDAGADEAIPDFTELARS